VIRGRTGQKFVQSGMGTKRGEGEKLEEETRFWGEQKIKERGKGKHRTSTYIQQPWGCQGDDCFHSEKMG